MSSFIGIVNGKKELITKVQLVAENTEFVIQNDFCTVFSTAASDRLKIENRSDSASNWIISGIGIHPYPNTKLVSQNDWSHLILDTGYIAQKLNGHFVGVIIGLDQVELITDQVGMRSLFVLKHGGAFIFSTRIDWLLPFSNREIDWEIFGEHWLSINSFSSDLFIPDIERIHSGANCLIDQKGLHHQHKSWIPKKPKLNWNTI